jgi:hypothetical protein
MADLDAMAQELKDRDEIARLIRTYAHGVDRRDWDLVRSCFSDDAEAQGSRSTGPIEPYLAALRPGVEFYPTTMHFMGNQLVELDGDTAQVETYAVAYHWRGRTTPRTWWSACGIWTPWRDAKKGGASSGARWRPTGGRAPTRRPDAPSPACGPDRSSATVRPRTVGAAAL